MVAWYLYSDSSTVVQLVGAQGPKLVVGDELKLLVRTHHGSSVTQAKLNAHLGLVLSFNQPQMAHMIRSIGP